MKEPSPVNPTVEQVDAIIKALLYDVGVNAAVAYIVAAVPFFGLPFVRQVVTWVVASVAGIIYKYLDQFVSFAIIDFQTDQEAGEYLKAVDNLTKATSSGDQDEIEKAKAEFKITLGNLVHLDGVN